MLAVSNIVDQQTIVDKFNNSACVVDYIKLCLVTLMDILTQDQLIERIAAFCVRHDMTESRFGRASLNNPAFVSGLREGKSPTLETLNKVASFIEERDAAASLRAKLEAPPPEPREEAEDQLPFAKAPVNRTGASSPTCSPTIAPQRPLPASASSRCSGSDE